MCWLPEAGGQRNVGSHLVQYKSLFQSLASAHKIDQHESFEHEQCVGVGIILPPLRPLALCTYLTDQWTPKFC